MGFLAGNKNAPPEALQAVYDHALQFRTDLNSRLGSDRGSVLVSLAANPNTPAPILLVALQSDDPTARSYALNNPNTPKSSKIASLRNVAASKEAADRFVAAKSVDTPPDVLEKLWSDPELVAVVADNPRTSLAVLENIAATSKSEQVRSLAKRNLAFRRSQP
jgi:hypothetical protein